MRQVVFRGPAGRAQITREGLWFSVWFLDATQPPNAPFRQRGRNMGPADTLDVALAKAGDAIDRTLDPFEVPEAFR